MAEERQDVATTEQPAQGLNARVCFRRRHRGGHHKRGGFTSKLGFVLAAAGSAVGLGNLWRFPYLAAKYGGGMFLLCYVLLAVTFGFSLLVLEIAIGRKTGKGVIGAFASLNKKFKWFGFICLVVPIIIIPYYSVIGGWVVRYNRRVPRGQRSIAGRGCERGDFGGVFLVVHGKSVAAVGLFPHLRLGDDPRRSVSACKRASSASARS